MPESLDSPSCVARGVVLVVDDQLKNVQVVGGLLTREGYEVIPATSGAQALQRMMVRLPDLVLLDVLMPELNGFEVCGRIRAQFGAEAPPVIFLSAADEKDIVVRALECGGVDYVTKPFNRAELLARVQTHIELKLARDAVARAVREKDELMSMVAHDLKNPIGAVRFSALSLAESGVVTGRLAQDTLQHIVSSSEEMLAFIERFLLRKAREADPDFVTQVPVGMQEMVAELGNWQLAARRKGIEITFLPPTSRLLVPTDPRALRQILDNLISNAIKFTPSGGRIEVKVALLSDLVIWTVEDSGPGFSKDDLPQLFQDYTRLSAQPTAGESSTGLGLAIAKRLAVRLGGELSCAESSLGGACLKLVLKHESESA